MEPQKILVLLYKFCESPDSIIGYKLCEKLVQEGYDVLVTSTSASKAREAEKKAAESMTKSLDGSIQIVEPEAEELEQPSPEWIAQVTQDVFQPIDRFQRCRDSHWNLARNFPDRSGIEENSEMPSSSCCNN